MLIFKWILMVFAVIFLIGSIGEKDNTTAYRYIIAGCCTTMLIMAIHMLII